MAFLGTIPRRCVNLPPGTLQTLAGCLYRHTVQAGPALGVFQQRMAQWLGVPYVFGTSMGRSAFQLALESLDLDKGAEIIFPVARGEVEFGIAAPGAAEGDTAKLQGFEFALGFR